ncbi:hypothetical protein DUNSADRAFT_14330 [Dunaliella salina]|uniref:F-box domain-containing protein n=1 Tax=Dunaliella salina TaxID=3046 RepID=A0ABQ7G7K4_DUNSA|nr:hypothetical protein DUNSADRAFT_14330 [Dunaliella salina]|eukprot:KAF5830582.1 hypothetical protein DUNSADRAFT_14330 [Dunaliella salina]
MLDELPSDICTQLLEILLSSGSVRDFLSLCSTCSLMHKLGLLLLPGQTDLPVPRCIHQVASDFSWRSQLLAEAKACANKPASQAKVDTSSFFAPAKGDAEDTRAVISDGSQLALYNRYMELLRGWLPHHTHRQFSQGNHNVQALDLSSLSAIGTHNPLPPPDLRTPAPAAGTKRCPAPRSHHSAHEVTGNFRNGREMGGACQRDAALSLRSSSAACDPPAQPSWACSGSSSSSSSSGGGGGNTESRGWSQGEAYVMSQAVRNGSSGVQDGARARACSSSPVRGSRSAVEQRQQKLQGSYRGVSSVDLVSGHLGHWGLRHRHPSVLAAEIESRRHSANTSNDACEAFGAAVNGGVSDARAGNDAAEGAVDDDDDDDADDADGDDGGDDGGDDCPSDKQAAGVEEYSSQVLTSAAVKAAARPPDPAVAHVPHASMPAGSLPALWRPQTRPVPSPWRLPLGGKGRDRQQREGQHVGSSGSSSSWSGGEHAVFVRLLRCTLERLPGLQDLRLCSNHLWGLFDPLPFSPPQKKPRPQAQGPEPQDLELHQQQCPPVSPLLRSLANLRVLHLAGSTGLRAQSLALLLLHCPNLLDLDVHQCIDLIAVTSGTSLAELLQPQASCLPSLRRLRGGWGLCTASLQLLLCHPGRAYALTSLDLGLGAGVNDALMGQLAGACTNLQEVKLTLASVTDQGIHDLLLGCRKLHVLVLLHCLGPFTPAMLPSGPPILQQQQQQQESAPERGHRWTLTNLQLMGGRCTLLSSHVSQLIGSRPNTLHTLALSNCPYITPALLDFLASRHQDSLRHVRLEQCGGYSWVQPCNGVSQPPGPHTPARGSQEGCCANESAFSFQEGSLAQESASACQEGSHAKEGFRFAKESAHISESQGGGCGTNRGDCCTECGGCNNCDAQGESCSTNRGGCHTECGGCNKCTTHGGSCSTNAGGFHTESGGCIKWGTQGKGCSAVNNHCHTSRHTHGEERPSSHCNEPSDVSCSTNTESHISWQSPAVPTQPCDAQAPCPAASTRSCDPTESPAASTQPCDAQALRLATPAGSFDPIKSPAAPTSHTPKASSSAMPNGPATSLPPFQSPAPQQTPPLPASRLSASVWPIDEASITQLAAACTRLCSLHLRHCCQVRYALSAVVW